MAWHKCSRYWKHGATCPVRGMPGHEPDEEEEEEEEEDADEEEKRRVMAPIRVRRPAEPGSVVALAEAIVREVETRVASDPVAEPEPAVPAPGPVRPPAKEPVPVVHRAEGVLM